MTEQVTDLASRRAEVAPVEVEFDPTSPERLTLTQAEHVLKGMYVLEPDYFASLLAEVTLGRPLDLSAIAKARKSLMPKAE